MKQIIRASNRRLSSLIYVGALILVTALASDVSAQRRSEDRGNGTNSGTGGGAGGGSTNGGGGGGGYRRRGYGGGGNTYGGGAGGGSGAPSGGNASTGNYTDQFGILSAHNIFMRDRAPRDQGQTRQSRGAPRTPEQTYVLTGIVFEEGSYHAYFEDLSRGTVQQLAIGGSIARGKVAEIQIDAVAYESNGQIAWVDIGSNLTGTRVASVSAERVNTALGQGVPAAGGGPMPDASNPNLTLEERMRLRRMQEQNPGAIAIPQQPVPNEGEEAAPIPDEGGGDPNQGQGLEQPPQPQQQQPQQPQEQPAPQPRQGQPAAQEGGNNGGGNGNLSLEEQMRLRRAQELSR